MVWNVSHALHTPLMSVTNAISGNYRLRGVAFVKLCGKISSKPLMLSHRHKLNLAALVVLFVLLVIFVRMGRGGSQISLLLITVIALAFGWHLVASVVGADMPVVVSMLNSYSGWAAVAAFMLGNDLLIVTGGAGGVVGGDTVVHHNRSFVSVIAGGFGTYGGASASEETTGGTP